MYKKDTLRLNEIKIKVNSKHGQFCPILYDDDVIGC